MAFCIDQGQGAKTFPFITNLFTLWPKPFIGH